MCACSEMYSKAVANFSMACDALNEDLLAARSTDKFRSYIRILAEQRKLAKQVTLACLLVGIVMMVDWLIDWNATPHRCKLD